MIFIDVYVLNLIHKQILLKECIQCFDYRKARISRQTPLNLYQLDIT